MTGKIATIYKYNALLSDGWTREHNPKRSEGRTMANDQNLKRAKRNVHDLVNTNLTEYTKMLTLTYAKTCLDLEELNRDFKVFMQNLKRIGFSNIPYLAVVEHQVKRGKREKNAGSLHMHVLLFTDLFIPFDVLKQAWGNRGSVDIQALEQVENVGAYVSKYITKEGQIADKKSYRTSRNIKKPTINKVTAGIEQVLADLSSKGFKTISNTYDYKLKNGNTQEYETVTNVFELKK